MTSAHEWLSAHQFTRCARDMWYRGNLTVAKRGGLWTAHMYSESSVAKETPLEAIKHLAENASRIERRLLRQLDYVRTFVREWGA